MRESGRACIDLLALTEHLTPVGSALMPAQCRQTSHSGLWPVGENFYICGAPLSSYNRDVTVILHFLLLVSVSTRSSLVVEVFCPDCKFPSECLSTRVIQMRTCTFQPEEMTFNTCCKSTGSPHLHTVCFCFIVVTSDL